jgi:hypothetical protein
VRSLFVELYEALKELTKVGQPLIFTSLDTLTLNYLSLNARVPGADSAILALRLLLASRIEAGRSLRVLVLKDRAVREDCETAGGIRREC